MQWICGPDGGRIYTRAEPPPADLRGALLRRRELFSEQHQFFARSLLPTAKNRPPLPVGPEVLGRAHGRLAEDLPRTRATPAEALAEAKERVNGDLQRFCPIAAPDVSTVDDPAPASPTS